MVSSFTAKLKATFSLASTTTADKSTTKGTDKCTTFPDEIDLLSNCAVHTYYTSMSQPRHFEVKLKVQLGKYD